MTAPQRREKQVSEGSGRQVVYIAGSGRSGSTLVERTLGGSPGWVNVGELIELFRRPAALTERCGCGELLTRCPVWSAVGDLATESWSPAVMERMRHLQRRVSRQRMIPRLLAVTERSTSTVVEECQEYAERVDRIYEAVASVTGSQVVVDASKWPGQALALRRGGISVRLLHVVRDPRGVAHSWAKGSVARPHSTTGATMAVRRPWESASRWVAMQLEVRAIAAQFTHSTVLRYEDFVTDPAASLSRVRRNLGFDDAPESIAHVRGHQIELPMSHGIAGNPSRFDRGGLEVRPDDAWRSGLGRGERRVVSAITAPASLLHGYFAVWGVQNVGATGETPLSDDPVAPPGGWPTVAAVLPTRGRPELLREAVMSVIDQDYEGDIDLVVVHDQEDVRPELAELARPGRTVRLAQNDHRPGLAGARNAGLDLVVADYVASCDDDDYWDTSKIRIQMARMVQEPDLGVLGAGIRLLMGEGRVVLWPGDSPDITAGQLLRRRRKELHSSTLLIRRAVYDEVGGYDENLPASYAEDYEFLLRAVGAGRVGVVTTPLATVRKYNASWFRDRGETVASALEYLLETHPQIATSRRGHARVLGQIAFARSTLGQRARAATIALTALRRWPATPHAALAMLHAATGIDPRLLLGAVRKVGRGIT